MDEQLYTPVTIHVFSPSPAQHDLPLFNDPSASMI